MDVIGVIFEKGQYGDFGWMLNKQEYDDALFIFNDNESQFRAFRENPQSIDGCSAGAGNAAIRPYQCQDPPRAAGIPTGHGGGYPDLDDHAKAVIDEAVGVIRELLATDRYGRVFYSASPDDPDLLGTGTFQVGLDVRGYIVQQLRTLGDA